MLLFSIVLYLTLIYSIQSSVQTIDDCHLLIVSSSTAALGALLSSSKLLDRRVCLLEPTDWIGGQLTAEILSAPDFADYSLKDGNFTLDVKAINLQTENRNPLFTDMLNALGNTGHCTVSPWYSLLHLFHSQVILPRVNNTRIYYNTVVKRVRKNTSGRRIIQIDAIQRTLRAEKQRCRFLSEELPDWYLENDTVHDLQKLN